MVAVSIGLLIVRLIIGLALAAHGAQKLLGMFSGPGLSGTGTFFDTLGYRPGKIFALAAGLGEFGGGLLTAIGLAGPLGPALIILVMIVAAFTSHVKNGFFASGGGFELNSIYISGALSLAFSGFGEYSLDHALGLERFYSPNIAWIVIAVAVIIAALNLAAKKSMIVERKNSE